MPRVEVRFDGVSRGARRAANDTKAGIKGVADEASRGEKQVSRFGGALRTTLGIAAKAAAGGVLALGGAVAYTGFKFNDLRQKSKIAFETMLGSAKEADAFLREIQRFAATTPFEFPELIQASQRLMAMGFEAKQVIPTMTAIGDSVAALGGSTEVMNTVVRAMGQIQAKGKASAEEMLQLSEAGIPGWKLLADYMGVTVPEAMKQAEKGAITSSVAIAALTTGMEKRFGGMMAKQSKTFSGLLSNAKDTFTQLSGTVMAPFFELATRGLARIVDYMSRPEFTAGVERFATMLQQGVGRAIAWTRAFLEAHWKDVKSILEAGWDAVKIGVSAFEDVAKESKEASEIVGGWKPLLFGLAGGFIGLKAAMLGFMVATRIQAILTAKTMQAALISTGIGAIVVAVGIAVGLIVAHWDTVRAFFVKVGRAIAKTFADVFNWLVKTALTVALKIVEPFSHLPGGLGGWARKAKTRLQTELDEMALASARSGASSGDAWGRNYYAGATAWMSAVGTATGQAQGAGTAAATGQGTATGKGPVNIYARGTAFTVGGGPGQGTHAAKDWQSGNAIDIFAAAGTPVLSPVDGRIVKVSGRDPALGDVRTGGKVIFGFGVTIAGFAGATYYLAHLDAVSVSPGQRVKRGQVIGKVATWKGGKPLVHVGVPWGQDPRAVTLAQSATLGGAEKPTPKGGGAKTPTPEEVAAAAAGTVDYSDLFDVTDADVTGAATGGKGKTTTKLTPAEKARRQAEAQRRAVRKSALLIRDQADELARGIARLPAQARRAIAPRMAQLRRELATVTDQRTLARLRRDLQRIRDSVKAAIAALTADVQNRREAFGAAFGKLADKALEVFDAKTDELIRQAEAKTSDLDERLRGRTPEEQALATFQAARAAAELAARRAELEAKRASLGAGAADETAEDRERRLQELADVESDLREMDLEAEEAALEERARLSREALEEEIRLERERREQAAENERKRIEDERRLMRERFEGRLAEINTAWSNEEISADTAQKRLLALLQEYGIGFEEAGRLVGSHFATGFSDALDGVRLAVVELRKAINELRAATGKGPIGPDGETEAERALRLRSEALNKRYGLARGGRVPGRFVGRQDTVAAMLTPGEEVIDRSLSEALRRELVGGRGGLAGARIYVLGTTEREVARALRQIVDGAPTTPSYQAPRG